MIRVTHLLAAAVLVGGVGLAASATAQESVRPPAVSPYTLTLERITASVAAVVGLIGAVVGGLALLAPPVISATATGDGGPSWPWCWVRLAW